MNEPAPILEVSHLSYSYDKKRTIFSDIHFRLHKGEIFVILGRNGAGKSTLLNCISSILSPASGEILVKGRRIQHYQERDLARIMAYVPQISLPTFSYTVQDYVVMGRAPHLGLLNVPGPEEYAIADRCLERMNIAFLSDKFYDCISGGERQQAQIARVLAQEAELVLLDEPANHLDYGNQLKIIKTIAQLAKEGLTVVLTSHMPDHAILLNGTVGMLDQEGHMLCGPVGEIITEERLRNLYQTDLHLVYIEQLQRTVCVAGRL